MIAVEYITTKEECEKNIKGVCEGCGGPLTAVETLDNAYQPTFWQGCTHCSRFSRGIEPKYFKVARKLVEADWMLPYIHMKKHEYEDTPEHLNHFFDAQTAGLSHSIRYIHILLDMYDFENEIEICEDKKLKMVSVMKRYGSSFVQALAECFVLADRDNLQRLYQAFLEYVEKYCEMNGLPSNKEERK